VSTVEAAATTVQLYFKTEYFTLKYSTPGKILPE
jgi:hypothetical protein